MRAKRSPSVLFTLILSFCTALLIFAVTRSFLYERGAPDHDKEEEISIESPHPVLLVEKKVESEPSDIQTEPPAPEKVSTSPAIKHVVKERETLSSISKKYYGTETLWEKIWEANQATIPNRNKIKPGIALVIPEKEPRVE